MDMLVYGYYCQVIVTTGADEVRVSEAKRSGFVLPVSVSVTDGDSVRHGVLTCAIEPSFYLTITDCSEVTLVQSVDYEEVKVIEATISARDNGSPPFSRYC